MAESKSEPEAAASCSLMRGGKRPTDAEQKSMIKQHGKLGVMPGDELCNISTFCWTIEDPDRFMKKCAELKENSDNTSASGVRLVVATGADDVNNAAALRRRTKCIIQVRGGPTTSTTISSASARRASTLIGPDQIKVTASAAAGSGSGS